VTDDDARLVAARGPRESAGTVPADLLQTTTRARPLRKPRQQELYDLQPGDPSRLGPFRCIHRLKPGAEPINDDKPTPLLGATFDRTTEGAPDFVVIKVLTGNPTADGRVRLREEQAWSHQQRVFRGSGAEPEFSWVARDFYQGVSLDQLVGQPEWTRERATTAARMILVGIAQVHSRHEIHCDIKPGNVIVHDRRATLIDFESSRDGVEQRPRVVEATKAYASPEQLFGGGPNRPISAATDLFSWALTVHHLFSPGRHPYCLDGFDEATMYAIDEAVGAGIAAPPANLDALPAGGLRDAVARALAWQPAARGSAADLLALLGETGSNTEVLAGATKVLGPPVLEDLEEPVPSTRLGRYATAAGLLGEEHLGWQPKIAYAGAGVLVAFALALITLILLGVLRA
jgi:serine/threonine protein kinase